MNTNSHEKNDLDKLIMQVSQSYGAGDKPGIELNNLLKANVREKEAALLMAAKSKKRISLWYLPMILNSAIFTALAFMMQIIIQNSVVSQVATGVCIYIILAGILLTIAGIKLSNFKAAFTIELNKGGSLA